MRKSALFIVAIMIVAVNISAQECNCSQSFDWMVSTFEKNDAGFQYVIDKKGEEEYKKHTTLIKEKIKNITSINECQSAIYSWLRFFRHGHIGVYAKAPEVNENKISDSDIRLKYKNEKTINLTQKQLITTLEKKKNKHPIEGIWKNGDYVIGIIKDQNTDKTFSGFIIKADSVYWMPKQIKTELTLNDDSTFAVNYYMRDHSKEKTSAKFINNSHTILKLFNNYWTLVYPKTTLEKKDELLLASANSNMPFVEKLSDKTIYLRVPSFLIDQKKYIDSVLSLYDKQISSTENLIIDIRNGTGGADASYKKLIPYLYTNPIRGVGVQLLATELNAQAFEKYARDYNDTDEVNYLNSIAKKMRANIGKFITTSDQNYSIDSLDTVMPFPKKVGIICNQNNGSTDEQFLIDAKQSRKVKVFGTPTGGMLDVSNMNNIDFPDNKFVLGYCMSISYRIPNYCIDGVGIQPDYFIDNGISEFDWVEYTKSVLEQ